MPNLDVIRNLTIRATATGVGEATVALNNLAGAQGRVASSAGTMATVTDMSSRRTLSAAQGLERLAASHDKTFRAQQQHARGVALLERATAQGLAGTREFAIAQKAVNRLHEEGAGAAGLNRTQMMELGHVAKSVGDEFIATGSIMRGLTLESGRLAQVLAEGQGGVGGTLKVVGGIVGRLATGWVGLSVGIGAAALVAGAAALSYSNAQERMQRSLEGTGRAAGLTVAQLDAVAKAGARQGNLSLPEARSIAGDMAQAGLSGVQTQALLGTTARFARFTGTDNAEAGQTLAEAFKDPVAGAATLDKSLGFLNDRVATTIRDYEESGQHARAQIELQTAYEAALKSTTDSAWAASEAMKEIKRWGGSLFDRAGALLTGADKSPEERLRFYEGQLPHTFDSPLAIGNLSRTYVQAQIDALRHQIESRRDPEADRRDAESNRLSLQVGPLVRAILPEMARATKADNDVGLLRQALSDPGVLAKLGGLGQGDVETALRRTAVTSANADPVRRMMQDFELARASADAFSLAERAAVDARRAELAVLRETGDASRAAMAAEIARNEAIEKANSDAEDRLGAARDQASLVGLLPGQRAQEELRLRYEGYGGIYTKDSATKSELNDEMKPVADDLRRAGETFAEAIRDAAKTVVAAASPYGTLRPFKSNDAVGPFNPAPFRGAAGVSDHERQAVEMFVAAGYDRAASTGFIGGLAGESGTGLDPAARNASGHRGIAQWDAARYAGLSATGDPTDFLTQVRYILHELQTSETRAGAALKGASTVQGGLTANLLYERPAQSEIASSYNARLAYGNALGTDEIKAGHTGSQAFASPLTVSRLAANSNVPGGPFPVAGVAPVAATALGTDHTTYGVERDALIKGQQIGPLQDAKLTLDQQRATLDQTTASFGMATGAAAALAEKTKLLGDYARQGIEPTAQTRAGIDLLAKSYGDLAEAQQAAQQRQHDLVGAMDDVRSAGKGFLDPLVQAGLHGTSAMKALHQGLESVASKISGKLEDTAIDSLLGKSGSPGGGLFGGALSSLFGGSGAGTALGASSFFPGFADGGYTGAGSKYQPAGIVHAGEYVMDAASVGRIGIGALDAMRRGLKGYADGGFVTPAAMMGGAMPAAANDSGGGDTHFHIDARGSTLTHAEMTSALTSAIAANNRALPGMLAERQKRTG